MSKSKFWLNQTLKLKTMLYNLLNTNTNTESAIISLVIFTMIVIRYISYKTEKMD